MSSFNTSSTKDQIQEVMAAMNKRPLNSIGKQIALRLLSADLFLAKFLVSVSSILWGVLLLIPNHVFLPESLKLTSKGYGVASILIVLGSCTILPNFKVLGKTRREKLFESMSFLILSITWTYLAAISYASSGYSGIGYIMLALLSALVFIRYDT